MRMTGEERIAAPRQMVWEALNNPEVLRQAIPGCQSLSQDAPDKLSAVVEVKIGPIGARFNGAVTLSDIDAPNGYTISGEGQGGMAGSAKGGAKVKLADDGAGTLLTYEVNADVGGRLAQLGGPIIDATAKQLAGKFFRKFGEIVGGETPVAAQPAVSASASSSSSVSHAAPVTVAPQVAATGSSKSPWGWIGAIALALFTGYYLGFSQVGEGWLLLMILLVIVAATAGYEAGRRASDRGGRS
jgi:carbon monoxide dehydrogenase subunit G